MLTCLIKDNGEKNVIQLTYENIFKELKNIPDSELIVQGDWSVGKVNTRYVCFLEADCLVSSGYFDSQLGLLKKNPMMRKIAMMTSATGVNDWANKFYGYNVGNNHSDGIIPNKEKKSNSVYDVQIGYVPGAIIHVSMLKKALGSINANSSIEDDLVFFSTKLSLAFWQQGGASEGSDSFGGGIGNRVYINPNATYVTTDDTVNDIGKFPHEGSKLIEMFRGHSI